MVEMHLDPKGLAAAQAAFDASPDIENSNAVSDAIRAYISSAIPGEVAEMVERLNTDAEYLRGRVAATLHTVANDASDAATALTSLAARVEALEGLSHELVNDLTHARGERMPAWCKATGAIGNPVEAARLLIKKDSKA